LALTQKYPDGMFAPRLIESRLQLGATYGMRRPQEF
jgi:hypothetical protein